MKGTIEKRKASGVVDHLALALTTFGVGYIPGAPGTYGSAVGVLIYVGAWEILTLLSRSPREPRWVFFDFLIPAVVSVLLTLFCLAGIWASGRSAAIFGREDPPQAVVDEVMGQLIVFCFVPFGVSWVVIIPGFILFRLFDIWKPYPIRAFENLPGGLGICADDIVAGIYGGVCLSVFYALMLWV